VLDPLGGVGPSDLKVDGLLKRLEGRGDDEVKEIIVATSPNVEGDATALYLSKLIGPSGVKVTRSASGVAVGGELEYADVTTLHRALEDRRRL
jgi:recombination protein RecR